MEKTIQSWQILERFGVGLGPIKSACQAKSNCIRSLLIEENHLPKLGKNMGGQGGQERRLLNT